MPKEPTCEVGTGRVAHSQAAPGYVVIEVPASLERGTLEQYSGIGQSRYWLRVGGAANLGGRRSRSMIGHGW